MPSAVSIRMCRLIGSRPCAASIWSSSVATNRTSAGRAHLRDQDRVQARAGPLDHLDDVAVAPVGVEPVDPHRHAAGRPVLLVQRRDHVLAGLLLVVRRDGVLEVEEHHVGAQPRRLLHRPRVAAGHRQLAAVQPIAHRHQALPADTPARGRSSTASNASSSAVGGLGVGVGAHHADPPDVAARPAPGRRPPRCCARAAAASGPPCRQRPPARTRPTAVPAAPPDPPAAR